MTRALLCNLRNCQYHRPAAARLSRQRQRNTREVVARVMTVASWCKRGRKAVFDGDQEVKWDHCHLFNYAGRVCLDFVRQNELVTIKDVNSSVDECVERFPVP
jgi:hypothetical protein